MKYVGLVVDINTHDSNIDYSWLQGRRIYEDEIPRPTEDMLDYLRHRSESY